MMGANRQALDAAKAAQVVVQDQFCVKPGETVLVTADTRSDHCAVQAVLAAAAACSAKPLLLTMPQLPYQGTLADPFIPDALGSAAASADVWFDMSFPYIAGSAAHDRAMQAGRVRYLLLGDADAGTLARLYGAIGLDQLFEVQSRFDEWMASRSGASCTVRAANGTEFSFTLGKPAAAKKRHADTPGMSTVPGSCIFYPEPDSVRGTIVLDAIFHEHYALLREPIRLLVDGEIRKVHHAREHALLTERALRRAGRGSYGRVIHLTCGFHPAAWFRGRSFIEDIRTLGTNAIGLGVPWWEPGGGENHPDGVLLRQSLWLDGEPIVKDGLIVGPRELCEAARVLQQEFA